MFAITPLYPTGVCSHTTLCYVGFISHRFILHGFPLPGLYPMWVLSVMPWLYPVWVSSPRALSLWVSSPKAFILRGCHPIQQGYISTWSFPFLHNNLDTLIIEELTSTKRLQVKQTERRSIQNVVRATLETVLRPGTEFKFSIRACLKQVSK